MANNLRRYATIAEVEEFADVTSTDDAEFQDRICQAEELIDQYLGYQCRFVEVNFRGTISAVNGRTVTDKNPASQLHIIEDYFTHCVIEIIGGTGSGQKKFIIASNYDDRSVTVADDWDTEPDTTSFYRIYQLAKFPRDSDSDIFVQADGRRYFKTIPDELKRGVAAQVQYMISQGDAFFSSDIIDVTSENVGNYGYSKGSAAAGQSATVRMIAPRARALLRELKNSGGAMHADNPTML